MVLPLLVAELYEKVEWACPTRYPTKVQPEELPVRQKMPPWKL
jgi:hypothetical protein